MKPKKTEKAKKKDTHVSVYNNENENASKITDHSKI